MGDVCVACDVWCVVCDDVWCMMCDGWCDVWCMMCDVVCGVLCVCSFAQAVCYSKREPNIREYWELP